MNRVNPKKVVGLSLQRNDQQPSGRILRSKRTSLENTGRVQKGSKARNDILKAQNNLQVPKKPARTAKQSKTSLVPTYRMPNRQGSVQPRLNQKSVYAESSRGSISPIRKNGALKPLINNKAWIPGGHPNSVGRNKLASIGKKINLQYHDSTQLAPNASVSRLSHHM